MTGRFSGVVSKIQQRVGPHFVRVWCGAHQLDLVMAHTYDKVLHEEVFSTLMELVGYFRRQLNLVEEMNSRCPRGSSYEMVVYEQGHAMVQETSTSLGEILGVD